MAKALTAEETIQKNKQTIEDNKKSISTLQELKSKINKTVKASEQQLSQLRDKHNISLDKEFPGKDKMKQEAESMVADLISNLKQEIQETLSIERNRLRNEGLRGKIKNVKRMI